MSISTLNDDLNILQNLAIPGFEEDVDVIQKLDDEPNDVGGLTAAELKAKFDEAGNRIKTYLNETLVPSISETVAEAEERAEAEAARVLAEEQRAAAEQERVSAEAEREQAEAERRSVETDRAAAESARKTAEDARVLAEQKRADTDSGIVAQATSAAEAAENAANKATSAAIHQPIVGDNGNWHTWSFDAGAYVDTGIYAGGDAPYIGENGNWYVGQTDTGVSATSSGVYVGSGDMPGGYNLQIDPEGEETDFIPYIGSNGNWFVGDTDLNVPATGPIGPVGDTGATGPAGPAGSDGVDGVGIQSVEQTTTSTEDGGTNVVTVTKTDGTTSTFYVRNGSQGSTGPAGSDGQDGVDGKSAYQYAVEGGYTGTEEAFAAKLATESPTVPENVALLEDVTADAASGDFIPMLSQNGTEYRLSIGDDGVPVIKNANGATVWSGTSGGSSGGDTGGDDTGGGGTDTTWTSGVPYTLTIIADEYVNKTSGAFESYAGWSRTDYTPCAGAARIVHTDNEYSSGYCAWYDINKNFISNFDISVSRNGTGVEIEVPADAAFFAMSTKSESMNAITVTPYKT